ncbi:MAG TPA: hypothetical protein VFJ82_10695 [Longimicrobium sp.]|nr:hypothetical protein [Longimicrobium sp.]
MPPPWSALDGGWSDPAAPGELHPRLRGEGGVAVARWLNEQAVAPAEMADVAAVLAAYASGWGAEVDPAVLLHVLRGALAQPGAVSSPAVAELLDQALARVHDTADFAAMLGFLRRTAILQTLQAGSGPIDGG